MDLFHNNWPEEFESVFEVLLDVEVEVVLEEVVGVNDKELGVFEADHRGLPTGVLQQRDLLMVYTQTKYEME